MKPTSNAIDMMNQNAAASGSSAPSTTGIQNFETRSMPAIRRFIE